MAENKKSFILYCDWITIFEKLSDEEAGRLVKHLFKYVNDQDPVTEERIIDILFEPIKQQLKRDLKDWENTKNQRSIAGKKGMESRWGNKDNTVIPVITKDNNVIKNITNITDTVNVTVTDTVNVSEKEKTPSIFESSILLPVNQIAEKIFETTQFRLFYEDEKISEEIAKQKFEKFIKERTKAGDGIREVKDCWNHFLNTYNKSKNKKVPFDHLRVASSDDHKNAKW